MILWNFKCLRKYEASNLASEVTDNGQLLYLIWNKVFKNGPSKICGRQPLKNLKGYGLPKARHTSSNVLKAVFHSHYLSILKYFVPRLKSSLKMELY